jgi:hypothetical protein
MADYSVSGCLGGDTRKEICKEQKKSESWSGDGWTRLEKWGKIVRGDI